MKVEIISDIVFMLFIAFTFFVIGLSTGVTGTDSELKARGLKEYDRATGRLIWTEKAGGEKGGGK